MWALGHVARSKGVPKGSLGVGFGTCGVLRRGSEGSLGVGFGQAPKGFRKGSLGVGFRDTWHTPKVSGGWLLVWALGTCGTRGRLPEGLSA